MTLLGRELGWTDDRLAEVQDADYLHDIGKIAVSDRVLLKAGPLSSEEWELMRQHPGISAEIVRPLFSEELTLAVRHHHERFDGDGYPDGLAGAAIPLSLIHISEPTRRTPISYAVFCLKKKNKTTQ